MAHTRSLHSLIIPVYKNEESIPRLVEAISTLRTEMDNCMEVILVVDGSPDNSARLLRQAFDQQKIHGSLIELTRNFGSFAAIRVGLENAKGEMMAVVAADLQEPPELVLKMFASLSSGEVDIVLGKRVERDDPPMSLLFSKIFWWLYRTLVISDIPKGGVDIFACSSQVRDDLMRLNESNSSLVSQLMWIGYRRTLIPYKRSKRREGRSAWSISKRIRYMTDSILAFSDLPIRAFLWISALGFLISSSISLVIAAMRLFGVINVPGYATLAILILTCCMFNNLIAGVVGLYTWRAFENTKNRPLALIRSKLDSP